MVKSNYAFAKRQRDLAKQQKKQEKEKRKSTAKNQALDEGNRPAESTAKLPEHGLASTRVDGE